MPSDFNRIAPIYDQLSSLIYGKKLIQSKEAFIDLIPDESRMLLMGGGTGNILNDLLAKKPSLLIDYVEPSVQMQNIARKKLRPDFSPNINFIHGDENDIPPDANYDVCTSFFVMDCFTQEHALSFSKKITAPLRSGGLWLFADFFDTGRSAHRALIQIMYLFFKIASNIETSSLPNYKEIFEVNGFRLKAEKQLMNGLVRSLVLSRT